jgi:hypothetical protein
LIFTNVEQLTKIYGRGDNLPTSIATPSVASFAYTYDPNKNKLTETLGSPLTNYGFNSTSYDDENRLVGWQRTDGNKTQFWNLSLAGDWNTLTENGTGVSRTHDAVHQLTAVGGTSLSYDAKGKLSTSVK